MRTILQTIFFILTFSFQVKSQDYFKGIEKEEARQSKTVYWEYGITHYEKQFAKEKAAKQLGFYISEVAGCVVTAKTIKSISNHNKKVNKLLSKQIGKDWKTLFYKTGDSIYKIDTTLINGFYNSSFADEYFNIINKSETHYELRVIPDDNPNIFYIKVFILDKDWKVTDKSILTIKTTYPTISFKKET